MSVGNKQKPRITLFVMNHETQIREVDLVSQAAALIGVGAEDFMRGAVLDRAAHIIIGEHARRARAAEAAKKEQTSGSDANGTQATDGGAATDSGDAGAGVQAQADQQEASRAGEAAGAEGGAELPAP